MMSQLELGLAFKIDVSVSKSSTASKKFILGALNRDIGNLALLTGLSTVASSA
jgi:hypothetical protein